MIKDKYNRTARLYPTVLTAVPLLLLLNDYLAQQFGNRIDQALILSATIHVAFSFAIIYLLVQVNRFVGKELERLIFADGKNLPTTTMLLPTDTKLSKVYRDRLATKILKDFQIDISPVPDEGITETRLRIRDAVGQMRSQVKDGHLLLQHNLEYGFVRNLFGGSILALVAAVISLLIYSVGSLQFAMSGALAGAYLTIVLAGRYLLRRYSVAYAQRLFQEYLFENIK